MYLFFSSDNLQTTSLSTKIEALELNLKKIQNELIMEQNKLNGDDAKERSKKVADDKNLINNESGQNAIIDTNDELLVKKVRLNLVYSITRSSIFYWRGGTNCIIIYF